MKTVLSRVAWVALGFALCWAWGVVYASILYPSTQQGPRPLTTAVPAAGCPEGLIELVDPQTRCHVCVSTALLYPACGPARSEYEAQPAAAL